MPHKTEFAHYELGSIVRVTVDFTNSLGAPADPTVVTCSVKDPTGGTTTDYVFGTDPEVIKDSIGSYHMDVDADGYGLWSYRWAGTGSVQAAGEDSFRILRSRV